MKERLSSNHTRKKTTQVIASSIGAGKNQRQDPDQSPIIQEKKTSQESKRSQRSLIGW